MYLGRLVVVRPTLVTIQSWIGTNAHNQLLTQTRRGEEGAVASKDSSSFIKGASGSLFEVLLWGVFQETSSSLLRVFQSERSPSPLLPSSRWRHFISHCSTPLRLEVGPVPKIGIRMF